MFKRLFATRAKPVGPNLKRMINWSFNLSGSILNIKLPFSNTNDYGETQTIFEVKISDHSLYEFDERLRESQGYLEFFRRFWNYYAGYGAKSELGNNNAYGMVVVVPDLPAGMSCFCPTHLELADRRANYFSEPGEPMTMEDLGSILGPRPKRIEPLNWRVKSIHGVEWVNYQSIRPQPWETPEECGGFNNAWLTPLTDTHYLRLVFPCHAWQPISDSRPVLENVIDTIMSTARLTLSPEAQAQKKAAEKKWPDATYSETREPEDWTYEELVYDPDTDTKKHIKASPAPEW